MSEKPILFSGEMVRAILASRKTQTRRIVKPQPIQPGQGYYLDSYRGEPKTAENPQKMSAIWNWWTADNRLDLSQEYRCPYGQPGDILWVREAWTELIAVSPATDEPITIGPGEKLIENPTFKVDEHGNKRWNYDGTVIAYRANSDIEFCDGDGFSGDAANRSDMPRWRPSIHMPRKAARLFLRVTNVRCERLQDITEVDARAEGIKSYWAAPHEDVPPFVGVAKEIDVALYHTRVGAFSQLWDSLNVKRGYGWDTNPLVWVVEFERAE